MNNPISISADSLGDLIRDRVGVCETCRGMDDHLATKPEPCSGCGGRMLRVGQALRAGILCITGETLADRTAASIVRAAITH